MRLGIIVRDDCTGLGYQTRDYYKWLNPSKVILIDISNLNGNPQQGWYDKVDLRINGIPTNEQCYEMLKDIDVLFTAETVYNLNLYRIAKEVGVKTICVENPEFYDHIRYPKFDMPDLIILPSVWLEENIRTHAESRGTKVIQIHHPVDRAEFPFTRRTVGRPIHIAGKPATLDRNGTWDFMQACPDGIVTTQSEDLAWHIRRRYRHSRVYTNIESPKVLYQMGDILVLPRKYGGNCLPLNEALSSGMPVIMPDISPNNHLLPKEWLVPAVSIGKLNPSGVNERSPVEMYEVDAQALVERIQWVKDNIYFESLKANELADTISWPNLLPKYQEAIASVL
jgi:glycosyltransferase involved in cell wall biosynthesis